MQKICYNTFGMNVSATQTLQINQKFEVLFVTSSGKQTSKERKVTPCVAVK